MNLEEWIISLLLVAVVLRQIRGKRLTLFGLTWPIILILYAFLNYFKTIPLYKSDLTLVLSLMFIGLLLGVGCGVLTQVYIQNNTIKAKARFLASTLWIIGMGSRIIFGIYATHGGATHIGNISSKLHLHSYNTWAVALIFMALLEVLSRSFILYIRYRKFKRLI